MNRESYAELTRKIIDAAIEVHKELGPGLLESVYEFCLEAEIRNKGLWVQWQVRLPILYKNKKLAKYFYIDLLVEDKVIIELKCVEHTLPVHEVQLLTYLRLSNKKLGLLLNFNVPVMRLGIKRKVNGSL